MPHAAVSFRAAIACIIVGMALVVPIALLTQWLPLPQPDAEMLRVSAARLARLHTQPWRLALWALVVAPLCEEFVFRGLILQMLRRYAPLWVAVLVPSVLFAGMHLSFGYQNVVVALVVGLIGSWLVLRSGSLGASILCHSGVNLAAVFVLRPLAEHFGWSATQPMPGLVLLVGTAASIAGLVLGGRALRAEFGRRAAGVAAPATGSFASA